MKWNVCWELEVEKKMKVLTGANCQKQAIHLARAMAKAKVASQGWPVMLRLRPCIKVVKDLTFLQNVSLPTFKLRWKLSLIFNISNHIYNDLSL